MEKLQKALQKARDERSRTTRPGTPPRGLETGRAAAPEDPPHPSTDAAWAALKPFEPDAKALEKNRIVTATAGHLGTSFDMLRTKVLLTMRRNGWKRLAVTSPTAGCGKTTTACNLAIGNARNQDIQTILIEFDLRRPSISKSLKMPVTVDLEEMLDRKVDFAEQALRYCSNIAICAAQKPSKDPSTILLSKSTQEVL